MADEPLEALISAGRLREAAAVLRKTHRSSPRPWESYLWLARIHERRGALPEAERALRRALALNAEPARLELARFLERTGRPKEAQPIVEAVLREKEDAEARIVLGCICDRTGDRENARRHFLKALKAQAPLPPAQRLWLEQRLLDLAKRLDAPTRLKKIRRSDAARPDRILLIDATTRCNQACVFCFERDEHFSRPDLTLDWIKKAVMRAKRSGYARVLFMGGEVTLCRWLIPAVEFIRRQGLAAGIVTNGVVLASPRFTRRLMSAGIGSIQVSLLSHLPEDDFRVSGLRRGWELRRKALENIRDLRPLGPQDFRLCVNIVLTSLNVRYLAAMVRNLSGFGVDRFYLKNMRITGNVRDAAVIPRLCSLRGPLEAVMSEMDDAGIDFSIEDIPLCQVPPRFHSRQITKDHLGGVGFAYGNVATPQRRPFLASVTDRSSEKCRGCSLRPYCCEPQEAYVDLFGDQEFKPRSRGPARRQ